MLSRWTDEEVVIFIADCFSNKCFIDFPFYDAVFLSFYITVKHFILIEYLHVVVLTVFLHESFEWYKYLRINLSTDRILFKVSSLMCSIHIHCNEITLFFALTIVFDENF